MRHAGAVLLLLSGCAGSASTDTAPITTVSVELEKCGIPPEAASLPQSGPDQGTLHIDAGRLNLDDKALLCAGDVADKRGLVIDFGSDVLARRYLDANKPDRSADPQSDIARARETLAVQGRLEALPYFPADATIEAIGSMIADYCEVSPRQSLEPIEDGFRLEPEIGAEARQCVVATMIATKLADRGLYPTIVVIPPISNP